MSATIALVGMPNSGKSTLFNRLTGGNARVANWPGLTVELDAARVLLGAKLTRIVDLPGIYDLTGGAEDERITQSFLAENPLNAVLLVLNATQLDRQLALALQLKRLGAPLVVVLNMMDEARRLGISIDAEALARTLEAPVLPLSAKRGDGAENLKRILQEFAQGEAHAPLPMAETPPAAAVHEEERQLFERHVRRAPLLDAGLTQKLDRWILHPLIGLPIFLATMYLLFQFTYSLGTPLQDWLKDGCDWLKDGYLGPLLEPLPEFLKGLLSDGLFDGVTTVVTFTPIIFLFFCLMALIEDSGYFARAAFLMDGLMERLGLDGRGFVLLMMGFGCNVPALLGTRVIRDHKARLLTMLTIPFSLCNARLQIFLFLATALFSPSTAPLVLLSLYVISILLGMTTAFLLKGRLASSEPFALELPPYRLPLLRHVLRRGWGECKAFLRLASTMIVAGVAAVWLLTHYPEQQNSYAAMIADFLAPVLRPIGVDSMLSIALIFGFVAKEVVLGSLAVIVGHSGQELADTLAHTLDPVAAYSFMLFTLTYLPCVSAIATLKKESKSTAYTLFAVGWSLGMAWLLSFVFYQGARLLGF